MTEQCVSVKAQSGALIGGDETILVVEDDNLVCEHLIAQLKRLGYHVVGAASGPEALHVLTQTQRFDLLFADVVMPGDMNGRLNS